MAAQEDQNCRICGREAAFYSEYLKQALCKKHLEKMLVRRINGELINHGLGRQPAYRLKDDGSIGYKMNEFIFTRRSNSGLKLGNEVLEDFAVEVFKYFTTGSKPKAKINGKNGFNTLYLTSEKEIAAFFMSKGLAVKEPSKKKGNEGYLMTFLEEIEKRRPGAMISIVKIGERLGLI